MKKIILVHLIFLLLSCSSKESYTVTGTIIELRKKSNQFLIHHDEIPGFMMKMTMPFSISDSLDLKLYNIGDSVKFKLVLENETALAKDFILLGKGTLPDNGSIFDDEYTPLNIGEIITDIKLLDTDSNEVSLSSSDGKFRLISYIFTRCPMPNMCPAVIVKNQYLSKSFKDYNNIEFIIVSFDYIYDTPSLLKRTYKNILDSDSTLKIYSSVKHINDIFTLAGQSSVSFWGVDENDIGHTLRSILIDPERRLLKSYDGTDWSPEIAKKDIKNILKANQ